MIYINARFLTQEISGVQRFAIQISLELKKRYPQKYTWVSPKNILQSDIAKLLDAQVIGANTGHLWEQLDLPLQLNKVGKPLLVNLCNTAPVLYKNKISTIHDMAFFENPEWFSYRFSKVYRVLIPKVILSSRLVLTVSEFSKSEILKYVPKFRHRIGIIPNGISSKFFDAKLSKQQYLLVVGSIDPRKNLKLIIQAFEELKIPNLKMVIIGSENKVFSDKEIISKISSNTRIEFTGYVNDSQIVSYYQNALLFVNASLYEGFGIPPIEAMACGTPVLVSDIPVYRELFSSAAEYFSDLENLKSKISIILNSKEQRVRLSESGLRLVKKFSWVSSALIIDKEISEI